MLIEGYEAVDDPRAVAPALLPRADRGLGPEKRSTSDVELSLGALKQGESSPMIHAAAISRARRASSSGA